MKTRTPTPTPQCPSAANDWYLDPAYLDAQLHEARRLRSEAFGQILADGWHALRGLMRNLVRSPTASNRQPALRH